MYQKSADVKSNSEKKQAVKKMRKSYLSDISRDQFGLISSILETVKVKTKEREVDLYEIFCAILYRLKTGEHGL